MNDRIKDKALRYLAGHYEQFSGHNYYAPVKQQDKLKLLKVSARPG